MQIEISSASSSRLPVGSVGPKELAKKITKPINRNIPSHQTTCWSLSTKYIKKVDAKSIGMSKSMIRVSILIDLDKTATIPKTKQIFATLEPTTLPITISDSPANTAATDAANSGKDVPKATIVTPIINGEIPKDKPISSAASTNQSEDLTKIPMLTIKSARYPNTSKVW